METNFLVGFGARADGVGGDVDEVSAIEGAEHSLHHADVSFHAADEYRVAVGREGFQFSAEAFAAKAGEFNFVEAGYAIEEFGDRGHGGSEAFRILRGDDGREVEDLREADKELRIPNELLVVEDGRKEFLLDVHDHEDAVVGLERTAGGGDFEFVQGAGHEGDIVAPGGGYGM